VERTAIGGGLARERGRGEGRGGEIGPALPQSTAAGRAPLEPRPAARQLIAGGRSVRRLRRKRRTPAVSNQAMDQTRCATGSRMPGRSRR
jgi:hypothetical protein